MAEAFVGTIKRDYVYTNDCSSAQEVLTAKEMDPLSPLDSLNALLRALKSVTNTPMGSTGLQYVIIKQIVSLQLTQHICSSPYHGTSMSKKKIPTKTA